MSAHNVKSSRGKEKHRDIPDTYSRCLSCLASPCNLVLRRLDNCMRHVSDSPDSAPRIKIPESKLQVVERSSSTRFIGYNKCEIFIGREVGTNSEGFSPPAPGSRLIVQRRGHHRRLCVSSDAPCLCDLQWVLGCFASDAATGACANGVAGPASRSRQGCQPLKHGGDRLVLVPLAALVAMAGRSLRLWAT